MGSNDRAGPDERKIDSQTLTAAGLAIVAVTFGLGRYCFGLFLPDIRTAFALSSATIGWIAGLSYAGYLTATFAGAGLPALYGARLPIILGGVAASLGMALIGLSETVETLALGVFIAGMSPGLAYPPFSNVVVRHIEASRQKAVYAWINSGTGFGVALAGPLALFAGENWRLNWLIFADLAAAVTLWNLAVLPKTSATRPTSGPISLKPLLQRTARRLFLSAFLFGIFTAIYWTYAVDLLMSLTGNPRDAILFWIILGSAGVSGCFAAGLVNRVGLPTSFGALMLFVGAAIATLPGLASSTFGIFCSAALFGAGFIVATALFGMWSMQIFRKTPSIAFGFTFFLISLGQGLGPVIGGYLAPEVGLPNIFIAAGVLCGVLVALRPKSV